MSEAIIIALSFGFALGVLLARPKIRLTEGESTASVRKHLEQRITDKERALLSPHCGWSAGDKLRDDISVYRDVLEMLPEPRP